MISRVLLIVAFSFTACGTALTHATASGTVDVSSFGTPAPSSVLALAEDGTLVSATLGADGTFSLPLAVDHLWSLRLGNDANDSWPLALARVGHFDRALQVSGPTTVKLGTVWLPPRDADVTRVPQAQSDRCPAGRLDDGTPCAVMEATVSCADGPERPAEDPTSLLLGTGTLDQLPGASTGTSYAVPSFVPPPIIWLCPGQTPL